MSEIVWIKRTRRGKHRPGTGYRVRTMHEPIIFGTIGEQRHKPFPSAFDGIAREHSRKPDEFYEIVLKCTPNAMRRADLFCDRRIDGRPGFIGWGKPHRGVAA